MKVNLLKYLRKTHVRTRIIVFFLFTFLADIFLPTTFSYAITGGPSQPEVTSFEPINTNQMVDPFTGDFNYNIPLFTLPGPDGGYPFNLHYHAGVSMDQEASWVGLGWNINAGAINRDYRSIPDDFGDKDLDKDNITETLDRKTNWTIGIGGGVPLNELEIFGFSIDVGLQLGVYYNNYRGVGYNIGLNLSKRLGAESKGFAGDIGWNLSYDSNEGIGSNPNIAFGYQFEDYQMSRGTIGVGTNFNSRYGQKERLSYSLNLSSRSPKYIMDIDGYVGFINPDKSMHSAGGTSSMVFASTPKSISTPQEMRGGSGSLNFQFGPNLFGNHGQFGVGGYFNLSNVFKRNQERKYKGIGYLNYDVDPSEYISEGSENVVKDYRLENDGYIHANSRSIGIPQFTYDIYTAVGQGIGNSFRPQRSDIGLLSPSVSESKNYGGGAGFEFGAGLSGVRTGFDISFSNSNSKTDEWPTNKNDLIAAGFDFESSQNGEDYEDVYFQTYGDHTSEDPNQYPSFIKDSKPKAFKISKKSGFFKIHDETNDGETVEYSKRTTRKPRSVGVQPITNKELLDPTNQREALNEFRIKYFNHTGKTGVITPDHSSSDFDYYYNNRVDKSETHVAGYMTTNNSGMRYVYGLPLYNKKRKDVVHSIQEFATNLNQPSFPAPAKEGNPLRFDYKHGAGSQDLYQSRETDPFSHAHLLTSVLGTDYHDIDNVPGPSDGDVGYWVKFNYALTNANYKWKSPFNGVNYEKGYETNLNDGTGNYSYGEKEIWFMATAETKTHIAEFIISDKRNDGFGASSELQIEGDALGSNSYKLERIDIYLKSERYPNGIENAPNSSVDPIKSVHFEYNYEICPDIDNYLSTQDPSASSLPAEALEGKLTLKKVWFTYRGNLNGSENKYEFDYNLTLGAGQRIGYDQYAVDRWGTYMPNTNNKNIDYPYRSPYDTKAEMDKHASLWNLKSILLPSGSLLEIEYEMDDYAYVQNERAMQMFQIKSLDPFSSGIVDDINHNETGSAADRRVYFKLEQPISSSMSAADIKEYLQEAYINIGEDIYFKTKVNMGVLNPSVSYQPYEMVGGYTRVNDIDIDASSLIGQEYLWAYVELDNMVFDNKTQPFHPFSETASRHMKINQPELIFPLPHTQAITAPNTNTAQSIVVALTNMWDEIKTVMEGFTSVHYDKGIFRYVDLNNSYLRLKSPDKRKYGGGHRVKKVKITDNWHESSFGLEESATYGTVYLYDKVENGVTISSGVASYEPMIGNDENPFRKPDPRYRGKNTAVKSIYDVYSEGPYNEGLFPGPVVGYSQVTTMSLNTYGNKYLSSGDPEYSPSDNTTGKSVYHFFTSRDFPTISRKTELKPDESIYTKAFPVPIVIGVLNYEKIAATQGFYVETNDMHGKLKKTEMYGQDATGEWESSPYSSKEVLYKFNKTVENGREINSLDNNIEVWLSDKTADGLDPSDGSDMETKTMEAGVDREFLIETKYNETYSFDVGLDFNYEQIFFIPAFFPIPSFSSSETKAGTVSTNKIVHKSGISTGTITKEEGKIVETKNLLFDQYTSAPILSSTKVNDVTYYNYNVPARYNYDGMGPAYKNIGFSFEGSMISNGGGIANYKVVIPSTSSIAGNLVEGDEYIVTEENASGSVTNKFVAISRGGKLIGNDIELYFEVDPSVVLSQSEQTFKIYRSGRRNLLNATGSVLTTVSDPRIRDANPVDYSFSDSQIDIEEDPVLTQNDMYNDVINYSAVTFSDQLLFDAKTGIGFNPDYNESELSYLNGSVGVWRSTGNYTYVADRKQSEFGGNPAPKITEDGTMSQVPMFNWNDPFIHFSTKWEKLEQPTVHNIEKFVVESRNPLGVYSAAYYDKNKNVVGRAINSKYCESGFEGFENYELDAVIYDTDLDATNLDFYGVSSVSSKSSLVSYPIYYGNKFAIGVYDENKDLEGYTGTSITVLPEYLGQVGSPNPYYHPKQFDISFSSIDAGLIPENGKGLMSRINYSAPFGTPQNLVFTGSVNLSHPIPDFAGTNNSTVVDDMSHTGQKSLKVTQTGNTAEFQMGRMRLKGDESYKLSGWLAPSDIRTFKLNFDEVLENDFVLKFLDKDGNAITGNLTYNFSEVKVGQDIEGWYKFDIYFKTPINAKFVVIQLPVAQQMPNPHNSGANEKTMYYDDIRITPKDAGGESYVYNSVEYKLEAMLDNNNYATFYYYDEEGNLYLVKRETEKGIITVQESRQNLKKQQP